MARIEYTPSAEDIRETPGGIVLRGDLTAVGTSSYVVFKGLPKKITLSLFKQDLTAGSGSTLRGCLRTDVGASPTAQPGLLARPGAASANIAEAERITLYLPDGVLIYYPEPDAGADNVVSFEIHLLAGY